MEDQKYNSKGYITFCATMNGIKCYTEEKADVLKKYNGEDFMNWFTKSIYDLMNGKSFYDCVDTGGIINYDGHIADIYVDGYLSNLGLSHEGLEQGDFLVDGETFLELCKQYTIEVNWANK